MPIAPSQAGGGGALLLIQLGRGEVGVGAGKGPVGVDRDRFERAGIDQPAHHRVADLGMLGEFADRALPAVERVEGLFALRVRRSGTTPVGRYSISWRGPSSAADDGRTIRSTEASGAR